MGTRRIPVWIILVGATIARCDAPAQIVANTLPGADIGAKINTADRSLGSKCGAIEIASPGTASTPVSLGSCHSLKLAAPVTWQTTITLPQGSSGQTISCAAIQTLSIPQAAAWVAGTSVANVTIDSCTVAGASKSGSPVLLANIKAATNLRLTHNTLTNATRLVTGSSAPSSPCGSSTCPYPNVTQANSTNGVIVDSNAVHNGLYAGTAVTLAYTNQASVTNNVFDHVDTGLEWWGGDSCVSGGGCTAGQNGDFANQRKLTHLEVSGNTIAAKTSCAWGSMGQFIHVAANTCTGIDSGDVGLDAEGSFDVVVEHNSVRGFKNGDLAAFWFSTRVSFDNNDATQDDSTMPLFALQNATQLAHGLTVSFTNNHFTCLDRKNSCSTRGAAYESITVDHNVFANTRLELDANNENQIGIHANTFSFTVPSPTAIKVHGYSRSAGVEADGKVTIEGNSIVSSSAQADGSRAILALGDDFNAPQETLIRANHLGGSAPFPIDIECDSNTGNSPAQSNSCIISDNIVGRSRIVSGSAGHGAVRATQSNNLPAEKAKN